MRIAQSLGFLLFLTLANWVNAIPLGGQNGGSGSGLGIGLDSYGDIYEDRSSFDKALSLLSDGNIAAAKEQYLKLQKQYPDTIGVLELGGLIKLVEGQPLAAEGQFRKALELRDDVASIWAKLGSSLIAQDRIDEGKTALRSAIKLDADNSFSHHILARLAVADGQNAEAVKEFRLAIANVEGYSLMHGELAELLLRTEQPAEAVKLLAPLTESASDAQPLTLLAYAQSQTGDKAGALNTAEQAYQRFPQDIGSWTSSVALMLELRESDRALAAVLAGRKQFPKDPILKFQHANSLQKNGQYEKAEKIYREMFAHPQGRVLALNNMAMMLVEQPKRGKEALRMARDAAALAPQNPAILDTLGWVQYRNDQGVEAQKTLRQAAQNSQEAGLLCHLAIVTADVESVAKARDQLQQCADSGAEPELTQAAAKQLGQ